MISLLLTTLLSFSESSVEKSTCTLNDSISYRNWKSTEYRLSGFENDTIPDSTAEVNRSPKEILTEIRKIVPKVNNSFTIYAPSDEGKLTAKFIISKMGDISFVRIISSSWNCKNLDLAIIEDIKSMKFKSIPKGITSVTYTFSAGSRFGNKKIHYYVADDSVNLQKNLGININELEKRNSECKNEVNEKCAKNLEQISDYYFKFESSLNKLNQQRQKEIYRDWVINGKHGKEPLSPIPEFDLTKKWYNKYLENFANGSAASFAKYRLGYIYDISGNQKDAIFMMKSIAETDMKFKNIAAVLIRIGEDYFMHGEYSKALEYYNKCNALPDSLRTKSIPDEIIREHIQICEEKTKK